MKILNERLLLREREAWQARSLLNNLTTLRLALQRYQDLLARWSAHDHLVSISHEEAISKRALELSFMQAGWQIVETTEYDDDSDQGRAIYSLRLLTFDEREQFRAYVKRLQEGA